MWRMVEAPPLPIFEDRSTMKMAMMVQRWRKVGEDKLHRGSGEVCGSSTKRS